MKSVYFTSKQFKIQFTRMGEPSFNPAVLEVLRELPGRYQAPGLMSSLSTIAPRGVVDALEDAGYQVIVSVGELEENRIGSNCGQYVLKHVLAESKLGDGYLYKIEHFSNENGDA